MKVAAIEVPARARSARPLRDCSMIPSRRFFSVFIELTESGNQVLNCVEKIDSSVRQCSTANPSMSIDSER